MSKFTRQPLSAAIKAAGLAGSLSLAAVPAFAAFEEVTVDNPFDAIVSGTEETSLVLQDFDDDGDLDALVFHNTQNDSPSFFNDSGDTSFYENTGSRSSPQFTHVQDQYGYGYGGDNFEENPFASGWANAGYGHPVSAGDLDDDGVADFLGGTNASTDVPTSGLTEVDAYGLATGFTNVQVGDNNTNAPFYGTGIMTNAESYGYAAGLLVDLDNDGDMDVVVTDNNQIRVFQNNGTNPYGNLLLDELTGSNNPFYAGDGSLQLGVNYYGAPLAAGDVDNDGDQDVIMGVRMGPAVMRLYINTGSAGTASFEEVEGAAFTAVTGETFDASVDDFTAPVMADIDNDGDDDLVVVEQQAAASASYRLFLNDADPVDPALLAAILDDDDDDDFLGSTGFGALLMGALGLLFRRRR